MNKWIKKGDKVVVIAGNDKGKVGEVLAKNKDRILVKGVNIRKKHMKQREQDAPAKIVDIEVPVHISNVRPSDASGKPLKMKIISEENGTKNLCYIDEGKPVVLRTIKKAK